MPPPKIVKTGYSRVQEFLTTDDIAIYRTTLEHEYGDDTVDSTSPMLGLQWSPEAENLCTRQKPWYHEVPKAVTSRPPSSQYDSTSSPEPRQTGNSRLADIVDDKSSSSSSPASLASSSSTSSSLFSSTGHEAGRLHAILGSTTQAELAMNEAIVPRSSREISRPKPVHPLAVYPTDRTCAYKAKDLTIGKLSMLGGRLLNNSVFGAAGVGGVPGGVVDAPVAGVAARYPAPPLSVIKKMWNSDRVLTSRQQQQQQQQQQQPPSLASKGRMNSSAFSLFKKRDVMKMNFLDHDHMSPLTSESRDRAFSSQAGKGGGTSGETSQMFQLGSPHHPVAKPLLHMSNRAPEHVLDPGTLTSSAQRQGQTGAVISVVNQLPQQELPSSTSGFPETDASKPVQKPERKGTNSDGRLCQICCDSASGFHYGVWSCEGCKAFFKRSLQASHIGPVDYICPATNTCKIDKHRRKSCQACRLRKCLEMGMSKGNYRKDKNGVRQPRQNRRKNASSVDQLTPNNNNNKNTLMSPVNTPPSGHVFDLKKLIKGEVTTTPRVSVMPENQVNYNSKNGFHKEPLIDHISGQGTTPTTAMPGVVGPVGGSLMQPPMHPMVEHLLQIDPPIRMTGHDNQQPDTELNLVTSIIKLADLELIDIINWAKAINGYADLNLKDRVHLLEMCWTEVIVCGLVWRSMPITEHDTLVFAPDLHFNRERCIISKFWPICGRLANLCNLFRRYAINREEFVLIRTMILLNSEMSVLEGHRQWEQIQQQVNDAFHYTVVKRHGGSASRVVSLLLMLPHIRSIGCDVLHWLLRVKQERGPLLCDLLHEMIDANSSKMHR